jgi:hypothetical protein
MTHPDQDTLLPKDQVADLGTALLALANTPADRDCLEVFADLLNLKSDATRPHLLTVLLEPTGGAQILTIGHARPGLTVQVDADLHLSVPQIWFGEHESRDS